MAAGRERKAPHKMTAKEIAQSITDYRLLGRNKNRREGNTLSDAVKAQKTKYQPVKKRSEDSRRTY